VVARVAIFEDVDIDRAVVDAARERLMPLFESMAGWRGSFDLADASSGRITSVSLLDSEDSVLAAEGTFDEEMPRALGELMEGWTGRRMGVEHYRVIFEAHPAGSERSGSAS
jgi:hypothetical protein